MRPPTILVIISLAVLVVLGGGYFLLQSLGKGGPSFDTSSCPPLEEREKVFYTIRGSSPTEYRFDPVDLHVKKCAEVTINFINDGKLPHTYTVRGVVDTGYVNARASKQVTFTAPDESTPIEAICAVPGHKERGMVGRLIVE